MLVIQFSENTYNKQGFNPCVGNLIDVVLKLPYIEVWRSNRINRLRAVSRRNLRQETLYSELFDRLVTKSLYDGDE